MLNFLISIVKSKVSRIFAVPVVLNSISFFGILFDSLQDGVLTTSEIKQLITAASGAELVILVLLMYFMKHKDTEK